MKITIFNLTISKNIFVFFQTPYISKSKGLDNSICTAKFQAGKIPGNDALAPLAQARNLQLLYDGTDLYNKSGFILIFRVGKNPGWEKPVVISEKLLFPRKKR